MVPRAAEPGGWMGITYRRLHGSPEMYHSPYSPDVLDATAQQMRDVPSATRTCWCILDNTALGEAARDALELLRRL